MAARTEATALPSDAGFSRLIGGRACSRLCSEHADHPSTALRAGLGSISIASDAAANGTPQTFTAWGIIKSGGISATALNFTGQRLDNGTGLLYYHARMYDPALARFVSADTIVPGQSDHAGAVNPQNLNRYAYVLNNPVTNTDPTGHCSAGFSWGMVNGQCYQEAFHQYMDPSRSFTDRAIGFTYAQADHAAIAVATIATVGAIEAVAAAGAVGTVASGISPQIEKSFLNTAGEGEVCWNCVLKAVGGETISGSGNELYGALKDLGYKATNFPKPNDVALFVGKAFEDAEGAFYNVKHAAILASKAPEMTFLSNNVTEGGGPAEAAGYYTLPQIHAMAEGLKDSAIEFFTQR